MLKPEKLYTVEEIANELSVTNNTIVLRARRAGAKARRGKNGAFYFTQKQYDRIVAYDKNPKPDDAYYLYELPDKLFICKETLGKLCTNNGIDLHKVKGSCEWITSEDFTKLEAILADRAAKKRKAKEQKKTKQNPKSKRVYWKLSVALDDFTYYVKACCLTLDDAIEMQESLLAIGISAHASPHIQTVDYKPRKTEWNL